MAMLSYWILSLQYVKMLALNLFIIWMEPATFQVKGHFHYIVLAYCIVVYVERTVMLPGMQSEFLCCLTILTVSIQCTCSDYGLRLSSVTTCVADDMVFLALLFALTLQL